MSAGGQDRDLYTLRISQVKDPFISKSVLEGEVYYCNYLGYDVSFKYNKNKMPHSNAVHIFYKCISLILHTSLARLLVRLL